MIQPWPQHGAQILMAWRGVMSTIRVRAKPLFCERHKGAMFPSSERKLRHDLIFVDKGRIPLSSCYLPNIYISQPSWSQRRCKHQRPIRASCRAVKGDRPQGWEPPAPRQPQGAPEMPAGEQGPHNTWVAFLLHRSLQHLPWWALQTLCSATCLPGNCERLISSSPLKSGWDKLR